MRADKLTLTIGVEAPASTWKWYVLGFVCWVLRIPVVPRVVAK